ncbi:MAG: phage portal protein [Aggregatilineales bacterium]
MMLSEIQALLGKLVDTDWTTRRTEQSKKVALYRNYADGHHRHDFTPEMKAMLRIQGDETRSFNANYCQVVVQTMADRLVVDDIVSEMENGIDDTAAKEWVSDLKRDNEFDGLQIDVHESILTDAGTFVFVRYDEADGQIYFEHELAYSSETETGVLAVYDRRMRHLEAVVKVWDEYEQKRVNIYYPDRVEKYIGSADGGGLSPDDSDDEKPRYAAYIDSSTDNAGYVDWTDQAGKPLGIPCVHFRNRGRGYSDTGQSELQDAIGLQDILNRTEASMMATSELHGFPVRWVKGFAFPQGLSPGVVIEIAKDFSANLEKMTDDSVKAVAAMDMGSLSQADIVPFIAQIQFVASQIAAITNTPMPGMMGGDNASGESLKQREVGLLAKCRRFQVKTGNGWEQLFKIAARLEEAFGDAGKVAGIRRFNCEWRDAETRADSNIIDNIMKVKDTIGEKETLMQIGKVPAFGFTPERVGEIMQEKRDSLSATTQAVSGAPDAFSNLNFDEFQPNEFEIAPDGGRAGTVAGAIEPTR